MNHRVWSAGVLCGAFLLFVHAACRPNQTVEQQTDDAGIKTSIKAKLASDVRFSTLTAVSVDVTNGIVTLAGPVHGDEEKQKIEETVRTIRGVVNVNNNLQVEASGAPPAAAGTAPAPAGGTPSASMTPPSAAATSAAASPPAATPTP
jgi:hyperosmotically inducible periplasmic protein